MDSRRDSLAMDRIKRIKKPSPHFESYSYASTQKMMQTIKGKTSYMMLHEFSGRRLQGDGMIVCVTGEAL